MAAQIAPSGKSPAQNAEALSARRRGLLSRLAAERAELLNNEHPAPCAVNGRSRISPATWPTGNRWACRGSAI